jgi:(1->4)-alpha-D-glucan 1-alpha-D-glucosylmutase
MRINRIQRRLVDGEPAPDRSDEYRLYQILLGSWPADVPLAHRAPQEYVDRISAYMLKAAREAKLHTSWLTANQDYEDALTGYIDRILGPAGGPKFLPAFAPFQRRVASIGMINSLAQVVLKLGSPGVPDFYQGTELWDLSLVDPDNRRPVDFATRDAMLAGLAEQDPAAMLRESQDGRIKMFVTNAGLQLRQELPHVFVGGDYLPLATEVTVGADVVAFARVSGEDAVIAAVPRLVAGLVNDERPSPLGGECWKTSRIILPEALRSRPFRNVFTGEEARPTEAAGQAWLFVGEVLQRLPVALLRAQ